MIDVMILVEMSEKLGGYVYDSLMEQFIGDMKEISK